MTGASAFINPMRPDLVAIDRREGKDTDVAGWVAAVNERAARTVVRSATIEGQQVISVGASGRPLKDTQIVLIIDGYGSTQPTTYHVLDELQLRLT